MRRSVAAVIGTLASTALLAGAKLGTAAPHTSDHTTAGPDADTAGMLPSAGTHGGSVSVTPSPTASSIAGQPGSAVPGGGPTPTRGGTTTAPGSGTGLRGGTWAGSSVTHKYGTLKVTITVSSGRIAAITESYTTSLRVSEEINHDALPKLRQEALVAQSARIDTVSGATYTSNAYRSSLQAAIDKARG